MNDKRFSIFDIRFTRCEKRARWTEIKTWFLLLFVFIVSVAGLDAQKITGSVNGRQNNEISPIPGAIVQMLGRTSHFTTDAQGQFTFDVVSSPIELIISATGFKTDTFQYKFEAKEFVEFTLESTTTLSAVEVGAKNQSTLISSINPIKTEIITETELYKAACCNLSESFQNNATVDISTTNAVTGSKEIQMLGLAGVYTQLTIENLPMMRGLGVNQALNFIPGSWVESIQVSKGTGSVANGYESITGQINTELKKPDCKSEGLLNGYINNMQRMEVNAIKVFRINERWSSNLLLHGSSMDFVTDQNKDGFMDSPDGGQFNAMHRWLYTGKKGLSAQLSVRFVHDERHAGTVEHDGSEHSYHYYQKSQQADALFKLGYIFPGRPEKSIGMLGTVRRYLQSNQFGFRWYDGRQWSSNANVFYQNKIGETPQRFRMGVNVLSDQYEEYYTGAPFMRNETAAGGFFEFTGVKGRSTVVAGIRGDYNTLWGAIITPRLHYKFQWNDNFSIRVSGGRGQRTANVIAENLSYMVSQRQMVLPGNYAGEFSKAYDLQPEIAWNGGTSLVQKIKIGSREGTLALDAYYTWFERQVMVDLDSDVRKVSFYNVEGKTSAASIQLDYYQEVSKRFDLKLAYRFTDARVFYTTTGSIERPYTPAHRALANLSYRSRRDKWLVDLTANYIGSKRLPSTQGNDAAYRLPERSSAYTLLNGQITRNLGKFALYIGGENLLNVIQQQQILSAEHPQSPFFDASFIWGPTYGAMGYAGFRWNF